MQFLYSWHHIAFKIYYLLYIFQKDKHIHFHM